MDGVLLQAVHTAYENRDPEEAKRLLHTGLSIQDCSRIWRCGDTDYINWLLSNDILPITPSESDWPELQELQLQCTALPEEERPACILTGRIEEERKK